MTREPLAVKKLPSPRAAAALLALACAAAGAQQAAAPKAAASAAQGPALGKVLQEQLVPVPGGKPGENKREFKPLPEGAYRFENGEYRSGVSGIMLKLPQLRDEKIVSVREAVVLAHGKEVDTSHILFVPDPEGVAADPLGPVSAVVVTRLRQDRPHDRESVLKAWEPRSPEQRKAMEARGIEFARINSGLGEGLERIVPNRVADPNFPYRTHADENAKQLRSVGVTRYLVSQDSALLEFSQVFPCRELAAEACKAAALKASDRFVQGVSSFLLVRGTGAPTPQNKASQPQGK
ncbi:hypothetical protein GCM10028796_10240 [Ramlibacter monticola]